MSPSLLLPTTTRLDGGPADASGGAQPRPDGAAAGDSAQALAKVEALADSYNVGYGEFGFMSAWEVLELDENGNHTDASVNRKYRSLSMRYHPDKCDHPRAQEAMAILNNAFKKVTR